ncbi:MAG TPA: permease [Chloroflexia bacterium]|nr:permease [Chloroflexia bacterium]
MDLSATVASFQTFTTVFLGIILEAFPFLLLGVVLSAAVQVLIREETLRRLAPQSRLGGVLVGSLLGLLFPMCECGAVPLTRRLLGKGVPLAVGVPFILASPAVNPVVIASTYIAFGGRLDIVGGRVALSILIAAFVGLVLSYHPVPREMLAALPVPAPHPPIPRPVRHQLGEVLVHAADETFDMGRYLVLGGALAAAVQAFVPQTALLGIGQGPVVSVLVMMALAALLSICSTVDAFVALSFAGTFSTGALLGFLVFGPMVDIKSTLMFASTFRRRVVALMLILVAQAVFLLCVTINLHLE